VIVCPDGELGLLPFAALNMSCSSDDEEYVIDHYKIQYANTGLDIMSWDRSAKRSDGNAIIVSAPDYDGASPTDDSTSLGESVSRSWLGEVKRFHPLPGTESEGKRVERVLVRHLGRKRVEHWTGKYATKERVLSQQSPAIIHIASHGFFFGDRHALLRLAWQQLPLAERERLFETLDTNSVEEYFAGVGLPSPENLGGALTPLLRGGLALAGANIVPKANGLVLSEEIASMNLRMTQLVVLSACDTGVGDVVVGEGIRGLRHAFAVAGARALVTSLWRVADVATCEFMEMFYEKLYKEGDVSAALHETQRTFKQNCDYRHPWYWGGFTLVGPGPTL